MDSNIIKRSAGPLALLLAFGLVLMNHGCRHNQSGSRPPIFDPAIQFEAHDPIDQPYKRKPAPTGSLVPPDAFRLHIDSLDEPGFDERANQFHSEAQIGVGLIDMVGLETGYEYNVDNQFVARKDGISDHTKVTRYQSGPRIAVVLDDGVSIMRLRYRYLTAWDHTIHEPRLEMKTNVLGENTILEIHYSHNRIQIDIPSNKTPTAEPIQAITQRDEIGFALEQSFASSWKLRLDAATRIENGFLHSPYRLVTLWPQDPDLQPIVDAQTKIEAENHPSNRIRWAGRFQILHWIHALSSALETGIEYGLGSWSVEHAAVSARYLQRIADPFTMSIGGGIYHQTRADFYRDAYWNGPVNAHWSADRDLCSFVSKWLQLGFLWKIFFGPAPLLGLTQYLSLQLNARIIQSDFNRPGAGDNHGFSDIPFVSDQQGNGYDAGLVFRFGLEIEGGF